MTTILLLMNHELQFQAFEGSPFDYDQFRDWGYQKIPEAGTDYYFYHWIIDEHDFVTAFEIHPGLPERILNVRAPLKSLKYVDFDPFLRIWIGQSREGEVAVVNSFAGIEFYSDAKDNLMIAVQTDGDLSATQLQQLVDGSP